MAVPKRRWSKARTRRGHSANWKMKAPNLVECPQCKSLMASHRVCKNCGHYNGREIVSAEAQN